MTAFARSLRPLCVLVLAAGLPALAGAAAGLLGSPPAVAAQAVTVDELLTGFAKMPGLYAEFHQESHFGLLAEPLIDTGTIHYADGKLARRTQSPTPSVVVMDDRGIEYGDGHTVERIDLAGKPAVKQFVDAFTRIFAGDRQGLEELYRVEFAAGEG
ncbi:MAG TPA: LolA-related protein, partial [Enhygromyxa sp.]|nr:LolA-related protein [Enhygromyxa sp.]